MGLVVEGEEERKPPRGGSVRILIEGGDVYWHGAIQAHSYAWGVI